MLDVKRSSKEVFVCRYPGKELRGQRFAAGLFGFTCLPDTALGELPRLSNIKRS